MRPTELMPFSVNQRLPSLPAVIPHGAAFGVIVANSVITPCGVMRPILLVDRSVNQRLPSGPLVIPHGFAPALRPLLNSVTTPVGVMRPILLDADSVNQRLPSGPAVIDCGAEFAVMPFENSVTEPTAAFANTGAASSAMNAAPTTRRCREWRRARAGDSVIP